jgi:pimeloyl-ACP methyl ester carboxylesterase
MDRPAVISIDRDDPRVRDAADAERRLFEFYELETREHEVPIPDLGMKLRVLEAGSGPPVVLVPGGGGELVQMAPLMAELRGWRLVVIDLPGAGMSDAVDHRRVDLRELACATLGAVVEAFDLKAVPFVTNSRGAQWTFWFAMQSPGRVSSMIHTGCPALILGTAAPLPMRLLSVPGLNRALFALGNPRRPDQVRGILEMLGCPREAADRLPDVLFEALCRSFQLPAYRLAWLSFLEAMLTPMGSNPRYSIDEEAVRKIEHPVRLIWGRRDPFGGVDVARRVVESLPQGELLLMDAGHVPFFDDPVECGRLIRECLA